MFLTPGDAGMGSTAAGLLPDGVHAVALILSAGQASRRNRRSIEANASSNVVVFRNAPPTWSKTVWHGAHGAILKTLNGPRPAVLIERGTAPKPR